jgi:5-methylcytosine-specific restriction enzyme subunit McrC
MKSPIQVFEHQVLRIGEQGFTDAHFDALVLFNQRHADEFFVVRHNSLKFTSYVGVLQVGGLTIEVLPKADRAEIGGKQKWHGALIDMLRACGHLRLAAESSADLRLRRASLFDLYMEVFLADVEGLLHQGLVKKYRQIAGNVTALKGRLVFSRDIAENLVHRERFFTAHQHYDRNNPFNRILRRAVRIVAATTRVDALRRRAGTLLTWMEGIDDTAVTEQTFQRLAFDRNTERYRPAVSLARLIILNYQPDVRQGGHDVLAILFDMNELFETYVLRQLKRTAGMSEGRVEVEGQRKRPFWARAGATPRHIRPDILVTLRSPDGTRETVVLDTKWKLPTAAHPDDADLKQMYAYNRQFGATRSFLIYPHVSGRCDVRGQFAAPTHEPGASHSCGMWFVDLFEGDTLTRKVGSQLLERLEVSPAKTA